MSALDHVPMVRCHLDAEAPIGLRYVPLAEFELWRHLMETRHQRSIIVEEVSLWVPEQAAWWDAGTVADELEPVVRVRLEHWGPHGLPVPVERFFPAETYPQARSALLAHYGEGVKAGSVRATPGYFVPVESCASLFSRIA